MQEKTQEKSQIKQNILLYLAKKGVSAYEFYKISGVTRGVLQQNNGISEENITRFLEYAPDVNIAWLLTGKGDMLINGQELMSNEPTQNIPDEPTIVRSSGDPMIDKLFAIIAEKDAIIREQAEEIGQLRERMARQGENAASVPSAVSALAG